MTLNGKVLICFVNLVYSLHEPYLYTMFSSWIRKLSNRSMYKITSFVLAYHGERMLSSHQHENIIIISGKTSTSEFD